MVTQTQKEFYSDLHTVVHRRKEKKQRKKHATTYIIPTTCDKDITVLSNYWTDASVTLINIDTCALDKTRNWSATFRNIIKTNTYS